MSSHNSIIYPTAHNNHVYYIKTHNILLSIARVHMKFLQNMQWVGRIALISASFLQDSYLLFRNLSINISASECDDCYLSGYVAPWWWPLTFRFTGAIALSRWWIVVRTASRFTGTEMAYNRKYKVTCSYDSFMHWLSTPPAHVLVVKTSDNTNWSSLLLSWKDIDLRWRGFFLMLSVGYVPCSSRT